MTISAASKSAQIRFHLAEGKTPKEIAAIVGVSTAFVRSIRNPNNKKNKERWRQANGITDYTYDRGRRHNKREP